MSDLESPWQEGGWQEGGWQEGGPGAGTAATTTAEWFDESPFQQSGLQEDLAGSGEWGAEQPQGEGADQCRPGEGPPRAPDGPRPLVFASTAAATSRNPAVGYAQQLLNRFLDGLRTGVPCTDTSRATASYIASLRGQLRARGQDPLVVDCRFGASTEIATKMFQACRGLVRDGKIGPRTWPLLEALAGTAPPQPQPPPGPTPTPPVVSGVRVRSDVWALSAQARWHPTLLWYARAVASLRTRTDPENPRSWTHLAWIHGHPESRKSSRAGAPWDACEHGSWHFLPWHRAYLHHFERIVGEEVVRLGGPVGWALPYWNYSDTSRTGVRSLPPAFLDRQTPDGRPNALRIEERDPDVNRGLPMDERVARTSATLDEPAFFGSFQPGFGGRPLPAGSHSGNLRGALELTPHGGVHVTVGGFMADFPTAGLDPVFWLHHANIDRLWEEWLRRGRRSNPTEAAWRDAVWRFGSGTTTTTLTTSQVVDPRTPPLLYRYADMPEGQSQSRESRDEELLEPGREPASAQEQEGEGRPPELVGATGTAVPIGSASTTARVEISAPTGPLAREMTEAGAPPPDAKVFLRLENITGTRIGAGNVEVHVNLPEGGRPADFPDRLAGVVSLFGVREASRRTADHAGGGIDATFDITRVVRALSATGQWDPARLQVRFTPIPSPGGKVPEGDVRVGRVSLFYA